MVQGGFSTPHCLQPPGHIPDPSKEMPVLLDAYWNGVAAGGGGEKEEREEKKDKGREEGVMEGSRFLACPRGSSCTDDVTSVTAPGSRCDRHRQGPGAPGSFSQSREGSRTSMFLSSLGILELTHL